MCGKEIWPQKQNLIEKKKPLLRRDKEIENKKAVWIIFLSNFFYFFPYFFLEMAVQNFK